MTNAKNNQKCVDEQYKIGPGRPPKQCQYPPGVSGNPRGCPRKPPSLIPEFKRIFEKVLHRKVSLTHGEKRRKLTILETGMEQLGNQFAKGDRYARRDVFEIAEKLGIDLFSAHRKVIEEAVAADHQAILEAFVARRIGAAQASTSARVLAPAELLDDDAEEPKATKKLH